MQSALTDFLASNNISAAQIHADYERRQREAQQQEQQEASSSRRNTEAPETAQENEVEVTTQKKKRKRDQEQALARIKDGKNSKKKKKGKGGKLFEDDDDDYDLSVDLYAKKKPLPGQLDNCEQCEKRFTVTPYSKTGPDGGLLCTKCSKEQEAGRKQAEKAKRNDVVREKRRQVQSNLLDGIVRFGSNTLLEVCIKEVANNVHDIDEFGDLPPALLTSLSQLFSKKRVLDSRTLSLFLRPGLENIDLFDCANLETGDYKTIISMMPTVRHLNLRNAGQFKDEVLDYLMERDVPITELQLDAANLVSKDKWIEYISTSGHRFRTVKLSALEDEFDNEVFTHLVQHCPKIQRLKLRQCSKLGDGSLAAISRLDHLEHLSLQFEQPTSSATLATLILTVGSNLRTLSLEGFAEAEDEVLAAIRSSCSKLAKLRFTQNDCCTDAGFKRLFSDIATPSLSFIDLSHDRSIDNTVPEGPEEPVGLASAGFEALMEHSGSTLEVLNICSCRHISHEALSKVFDGRLQYPSLKDVNISFSTKIDTTVVAAMFKSCLRLTKVTAFGCFNVTDVEVPRGVALIGIPRAQDSLIQGGEADIDVWH
ncbi:uncharacterized protein KY384_009076 [Bacidia gigantensis]|uniref:uncharacterized protein n=1 Tax=Bacidia gigantensis TaxID=2732470 RepID=UPI001D04CEE6|nr:uncharacterized protein KY384_009076 [Bacidia gigantensis]KAG8525432.1 hypothetical protein KY384_009076 [Bacidia gigantensis]